MASRNDDDDDEDLFNLDCGESNSTLVTTTQDDDVLAAIDSVLKSDSDEEEEEVVTASPARTGDDDNAKVVTASPARTGDDDAKSVTASPARTSGLVDLPLMQSTPLRCQSISSQEPVAKKEEEEVDASILYEEDDVFGSSNYYESYMDDEVEAVDLDQLAKTLDDSILYTTAEEDLENASKNSSSSKNNTTVVAKDTTLVEESKPAVKEEADSTVNDKDKEGKSNERQSKAPKAQPQEEKIFAKQAQVIKQLYYERALKSWRQTTDFTNGYNILPLCEDRLKPPRLWRDQKTGMYYGSESPSEWADNFHPMWEEYRKIKDEDKYGSFIHHKWGWKHSIDITRNLTKFSKKSDPSTKPATKKAANKSTLKVQNQAADTTVSGKLIDEKDLFTVLLKRFGEADGGDLAVVDSWEDEHSSLVGTKEDEGDDSVEQGDGQPPPAICQFCRVVCLCSPGKRQKRPYYTLADPTRAVDHETPNEAKQLRLEELQTEIRDTMASQMKTNAGKSSFKQHILNYYANSAANVLASTTEALELAQHYRVDDRDRPYFSREQCRELLSVELIQDQFRNHYKSPYAGEGHSDDDDEQEQKKQEGPVWNKSVLEEY